MQAADEAEEKSCKYTNIFRQFPEHFIGEKMFRKNIARILRFDLIYMWVRFLVMKLLNIVPALAPLFPVRKHDHNYDIDIQPQSSFHI